MQGPKKKKITLFVRTYDTYLTYGILQEADVLLANLANGHDTSNLIFYDIDFIQKQKKATPAIIACSLMMALIIELR